MTMPPPTPVPEFLASPRSFDEFVTAWELGTLDRSRWTHAAHVAVAAYYAWRLPADDAFEAMRSGILRFNASVGIENSDSSGYHETLTRFWCETIGGFVRSGHFASPYHAAHSAVAMYGNKRDLHRAFYGHDIVADARARKEWIRPPAG